MREKKDYTIQACVVITLYFIVFWIYCCLWFPVLGWHGPACICDGCLEQMDRDRPEPQDVIEKRIYNERRGR